MRITVSLAILLTLGMVPGGLGQAAFGDVIFTNFSSPDIPPNFVGGGGWLSDSNSGEYFQESSSPFTLTDSAANVTAAYWYGAYLPPSYSQPQIPDQDSFTISFYTDAGNNPAIAPMETAVNLSVSRQPTSFTIAGGDLNVYYYQATFDPIGLSSGVDYWLSILNDTPADDGPTRWAWVTHNNGSGPHAERSSEGGQWKHIANGSVPGFYLVPEPVSLVLLGVGGVALVRRHR